MQNAMKAFARYAGAEVFAVRNVIVSK